MKAKKIQEVVYNEIMKRDRNICIKDFKQLIEQIKQHIEVREGDRVWVDIEKYPEFSDIKEDLNCDYGLSKIIDFVKYQNSLKIIICYQDITRYFNITKTTTRKRLNKLIELGLVETRKDGRNKMIFLKGEVNKMPISMKQLNTLKEEDCFLMRSTAGVVEKVIAFLKENKENAFLAKEVVEELNKNLVPNEKKYNKETLSSTMKKAVKRRLTPIKRKGSYYYYETINKKEN